VTLRKKYYNIIEDMKGKIRVYCRCRPMAAYEIERKCSPVVQFPDECHLRAITLTTRTPRLTENCLCFVRCRCRWYR
jgi:hypothetical protein